MPQDNVRSGANPLTICIAAIGKEKNEEAIVFATDHMVTMESDDSTWTFEHSLKKYRKLNDKTVAMVSGDPLLIDDLTKLSDSNLEYQKIKREIFDNFKKMRGEKIKNDLLDLFDIDKKFLKEQLAQDTVNPLVLDMLETLNNYVVGARVILVGFDDDKAKISEITERHMKEYRDFTFYAIGSGSTRAMDTLFCQGHKATDNLTSTVYDVYKAKRNAEVTSDVGKDTDLIILTKSSYIPLSAKKMKTLIAIYEKELQFGRKHKEIRNIKNWGE